MCVVVQHHLGKGTRCAPPLHPPSLWLVSGYRTHHPARERFAAQPRARRLRSPCTHDQRGYRAPLKPTRRTWRRPSPPAPNHGQPDARLITDQGSVTATPDTPMTISWRRLHRDQVRKHVIAALPWNLPFDQPCAVWMPSPYRR